MGTQAAEIRSLALLRQPVFIYGEPGTGKEQIARYLYLHSSLATVSYTHLDVYKRQSLSSSRVRRM